jgi:hypothetical protein
MDTPKEQTIVDLNAERERRKGDKDKVVGGIAPSFTDISKQVRLHKTGSVGISQRGGTPVWKKK